MDRIRALVGAAVFLTIGALVALMVASSLTPGDPATRPLMSTGETLQYPTDAPLRLSALDGDAPTAAHGAVVGNAAYVVLKVPKDSLDTALAQGWRLPPWTEHPDGRHVLIAYDAKGTYLGCSVDFIETLYDPPDVWLIDVCHQGQFNALDHGAPRPGGPTGGPLTPVKVVLEGGPDPWLHVQRID